MFSDIFLPLAGGLSIFLFGMKIMELALNRWAGPYLKAVVGNLTKTPLRGMATGTVVTALLQSSSALTVITIGMVNAGVLSFAQTLGVILGTNIGTCITTELLGLDITQYGLPLLIGSVAVWMATLAVSERWLREAGKRLLGGIRCIAAALGGFACVLLGMSVMSSISASLQSLGFFAWFLEQSQQSLVWGVLAGACLTAIIQSSSAAIAIAMGLAAVQAISIDLGIAITLGANIGTCVTGFIASIGGSRNGRNVAWAQLLLNVLGTLLFLPFIAELQTASAAVSAKPSVQIAHAQTLFNVACSLIALPFCYLPIFRRNTPTVR